MRQSAHCFFGCRGCRCITRVVAVLQAYVLIVVIVATLGTHFDVSLAGLSFHDTVLIMRQGRRSEATEAVVFLQAKNLFLAGRTSVGCDGL